MAYFFRILSRDANLDAAQRTELGLGPIGSDPRDTLTVVEVIDVSPLGTSVVVQFNHVYERAAVNKRQLAAAIRARAQTEIDLTLFDAGGESALVYDPARVVDGVVVPGPEFPV